MTDGGIQWLSASISSPRLALQYRNCAGIIRHTQMRYCQSFTSMQIVSSKYRPHTRGWSSLREMGIKQSMPRATSRTWCACVRTTARSRCLQKEERQKEECKTEMVIEENAEQKSQRKSNICKRKLKMADKVTWKIQDGMNKHAT